jgi:hypothetical protein
MICRRVGNHKIKCNGEHSSFFRIFEQFAQAVVDFFAAFDHADFHDVIAIGERLTSSDDFIHRSQNTEPAPGADELLGLIKLNHLSSTVKS